MNLISITYYVKIKVKVYFYKIKKKNKTLKQLNNFFNNKKNKKKVLQ